MNSIAERLEFVNMIAGESELKWHDAFKENPTTPRDYIVFIGHTGVHGEKRGFISFAHWTGRYWDRFNLLDEENIPHIIKWIEWMPPTPDGYVQED